MTEITDFERELRAALSEAHAAAAEPTGLADRLVAAATSDPSRPHLSALRRSRPHRSALWRSRRWLPPLLAAAAVLIVAVVTNVVVTSTRADREQPATPIPGLTTPLIAPQSQLDVREVGFHVEPVPGVEPTDDWGIEPDHQWTTVNFGGGGLVLKVAVYYQGSSPEVPSTGTSEAVTVNGVSGTYTEEIRHGEPPVLPYWRAHLAWEYAPNSWAEVSRAGVDELAAPPDLRNKFLTVAEAVRSGGGTTMRVPVRFGTVPASLPSVATAFSVSVSYRYDTGDWLWYLSVGDISILVTSDVGEDCHGSEGQPSTEEFTYRGYPGSFLAGECIGLHLGDADVFFDFHQSPDLPIEDMKQVLAELTVAPDDPTTWFDLRTSLGG